MAFRINLKVGDADLSEKFAHIYQTTRHTIPEQCNLNTRHSEKLNLFGNLA